MPPGGAAPRGEGAQPACSFPHHSFLASSCCQQPRQRDMPWTQQHTYDSLKLPSSTNSVPQQEPEDPRQLLAAFEPAGRLRAGPVAACASPHRATQALRKGRSFTEPHPMRRPASHALPSSVRGEAGCMYSRAPWHQPVACKPHAAPQAPPSLRPRGHASCSCLAGGKRASVGGAPACLPISRCHQACQATQQDSGRHGAHHAVGLPRPPRARGGAAYARPVACSARPRARCQPFQNRPAPAAAPALGGQCSQQQRRQYRPCCLRLWAPGQAPVHCQPEQRAQRGLGRRARGKVGSAAAGGRESVWRLKALCR